MFDRIAFLFRAYRYRFRVDPAEVRFVRQSLRPRQIAVDIGCHKGAYTYWMRRRVGPSGAVYAFEPQPRQVAYLRHVFSAMRYDNVELVPMALSDKCGQMPLYTLAMTTHFASLVPRDVAGVSVANSQPRTNSKSASKVPPAIQIDVTTLDEFFTSDRKPPHFLKIDVEGHELPVLEGGRHILESHHPTILVECEARHCPDGDIRPVFNLFESLGYTGSFFCGASRRPLAEFDPAIHQWLDSDTVDLPASYVSNFAFELGK